MADWLPTDLSVDHLHRTWLYWVSLVVLIAEFLRMRPRARQFLVATDTNRAARPGPWCKPQVPSQIATFSMHVLMITSGATINCLQLENALACFITVIGLLRSIVNFAIEIPKAHDGATISAAIGTLIGGARK